jgi:hypothetical protein
MELVSIFVDELEKIGQQPEKKKSPSHREYVGAGAGIGAGIGLLHGGLETALQAPRAISALKTIERLPGVGKLHPYRTVAKYYAKQIGRKALMGGGIGALSGLGAYGARELVNRLRGT